MASPSLRSQGERKPVTILFTDIVGSTAIAERLDPEEWREVVSGAHRRVSEAVTRYEGTIAQLLGDGVLAFFGAPVAHEDDPTRAVRAALDIQAAIADYARDLAGYIDDFAMRIGIHTGEVVVGEVGSAEHAEYLAVGDAVNLAARLQSAAAPGKILVSESIARLARHAFELASLGEIAVKGKTKAVAVFEVVAPLAAPARTRGLAVLRSPLVGREAELAVLTGALDGLCQGHGAIVALLGEAGIGKSRLVEEAHAWAEEHLCQPPHWLEGRALSYGATLPYWTVSQLLKADLGLSDGDPEVRARVALRRRLNALPLLGEAPAELYPYLAHLLGLKLEGEAAESLDALDSETLKYQLLVCVRRYFEALAEREPLVLVCEDVHWAEPSTLDALGELLAPTDHVPLLLLLVGRVERQHGSWRLKQRAETEYAHRYAEIVLRPLNAGDSAQLVDNLLAAPRGKGEAFPEKPAATARASPGAAPGAEEDAARNPTGMLRNASPLQRLLLDRAEGNPFYLEELVASLVEQGALVRERDVWQVKAPIENLSIPDTVQGVILARIDRLEEDVRSTMQMASVIGRSFVYRLLQAIAAPGRGEAFAEKPAVTTRVAPGEAPVVANDLTTNASPLLRHLVVLQRADLVREKAVRPELEYIFKHSLAQEAAYGSLLLERRREFHRRTGEALEALFADRQEEFYGLLAHHFDRAEQAEKAVHYLMAAGDKARLEEALEEAARFYQRAVERLEAAGDAEVASRTWLKLALVHQADFDFTAAHEAYERGFSWGRQAPHRATRVPDEGAVLRLSSPFPVNSLDPGRLKWVSEVDVVPQLFAGLAQIDADLNVVPHAARSWEVLEDGLCWRIYLRPDVCWTDGSPVTAHDYVYAWLRNLDPQVATGEYPASLLDDVAGARAYRLGQLRDPEQVGVRAIDDLTLEVRLEQPLAYFSYLLALWITYAVPSQVVQRWGEQWWHPEHILSSGAFRLAHFEPNHVILQHNPLYFGERTGNLARAEYLAIPEEKERLQRFRTGDLDRVDCFELPDDLAPRLKHSRGLMSVYFLLSPQPPLDDPRVRLALAMAVNWRSLAEVWGASPASGGLVPPGMPGHTPGLGLPYNPEQAHRLLAEAGYLGGYGLRPLHIHGWSYMPEIGIAAAQLLREALPVEVNLQLVAPSDLLEGVVGTQIIYDHWLADLPDPDNFLRQGNAVRILRETGWQNPELDALLERAAHTPDRAVRMALYRQADRLLVVEGALVVPLAYTSEKELSQPWVHGVRPDKTGCFNLKDVVVEKHAST
jgi:ABC-type oligopeptide transport system substrate-binding subunit/class 3 adenylate cyclase